MRKNSTKAILDILSNYNSFKQFDYAHYEKEIKRQIESCDLPSFRIQYNEIQKWISDKYKNDKLEDIENAEIVKDLMLEELKSKKKLNEIQKSIYRFLKKIEDHFILERQRKQDSLELEERINESLKEQKTFLENALDKKETSMLAKSYQANITFLGIFSAIIFALFGGVSFITDIITNIYHIKNNSSVIMLFIISLVFLLIMGNLIFMLYVFISKSIGKEENNRILISFTIISNGLLIIALSILYYFYKTMR